MDIFWNYTLQYPVFNYLKTFTFCWLLSRYFDSLGPKLVRNRYHHTFLAELYAVVMVMHG